MKVQKLSTDVISRIQSGITITDATQCILELVYNSLDANSTAIAVKVNLQKYQIQVIDNGNGITIEDLNLIGKRYMTSKCHNVSDLENHEFTYGYRGQAIPSILDVCTTLTIESKSKKDKHAFKKVFINSKALPVSMSSKDKYSSGTMVIVDDFMSTMPVRRKRISEIFDVEEIRNQLEYLAVIHHDVCFILRDENKNQVLLQTRKKSDSIYSLKEIFGMAASKFLTPLDYKNNNYRITGFISRENHTENNLQFLYVNRRIVLKSRIHELVNTLITKYCGKENPKNVMNGHGVTLDIPDMKNHHVFLVQVQCPYTCYEVFANLRKTTVEFSNWEEVLKCVHKAVKTALKIDGEESVDGNKIRKRKFSPKKYQKDEKSINPVFGTSQLINAVRGVPAKRKKPNEKRKCSTPKLESPPKKQLFQSEAGNSKKNAGKLISTGFPESPIPKSVFKKPIEKPKKPTSENLQVEFKAWIKDKAKNDLNAFNLYKDFIEFKRKSGADITDSYISEATESPLAGISEPPVVPVKKLRQEKLPEIFHINKCNFPRKEQKDEIVEKRHKEVDFKENLNFDFNVRKLNAKQVPTPTTSEADFSKWLQFRNVPSENSTRETAVHTWASHYGHLFEPKGSDFENLEQVNEKEDGEGFKMQKDKKVQTKILETSDKCIQSNLVSTKNEEVQTVTTAIDESDVEEYPSLAYHKSRPKLVIPETPSLESSELVTCAQRNNRKSIESEKSTGNTLINLGIVLTDVLPDDKKMEDTSVPDTAPVNSGFTLSERYHFVPKGLSPILPGSRSKTVPVLNSESKSVIQETISGTNDDFLNDVKWKDELSGFTAKPQLPVGLLDELRQKTEEKMIYHEKEIQSATVEKSQIKVIGQLDRKFIIAMMSTNEDSEPNLVTIFDQHAVDERIRLEKLMREYKNLDGTFTSSALSPPLVCWLNESTVRIISHFKEKLMEYGIKVAVLGPDSLSVEEVPTCLFERHIRKNDESLDHSLQMLITEISDILTETKGASLNVPKLIYDVVSLQACRGAVKFNKLLSIVQMEEMLKELSRCEVPFQCAHGRPSVIPVIDLGNSSLTDDMKLDPQKMKDFKAKVKQIDID